MKIRPRRLAMVLAAAAGLMLATPSPAMGSTNNSVAAATDPYCGIYWGSLAKTATVPGAPYWFTPPADGSAVDNVRAGQHDCYDRIVIDVLGQRPGYRVQYVDAIAVYGVDARRGPAIPIMGRCISGNRGTDQHH